MENIKQQRHATLAFLNINVQHRYGWVSGTGPSLVSEKGGGAFFNVKLRIK